MKKLFLLIPLLCIAVSAAADNRSQSILTQLSAKIKALGEYHARFEVVAEDNNIAGVYTVSGDKYFMQTEDYRVISDGKVKYEINHYDREVIVDRIKSGDRNILSNPTRAFDFASDIFNGTYVGTQTVRGVASDIIKLTPTDSKSTLKSITLAVSQATGLPVEIRYRSEGVTDEVVVRIVKIESGPLKDAVFKFDRANYAGYEVVDFR